ncbi:tetratricopeptide repeat protein [Chromobacterium subtsugae]|uniref:tetratricopeptide repeat protein n=1 Tax=Chromobacterium subtsugae TaxID=251747 RepID=UPI00069AE8FB|nr:tetratricopeptide repeat protein [Chromobacterium subtsugae]
MSQEGGQRLRQAQRRHLAGETAGAEADYRALLADAAIGVAARHWLGFLLLQQGRLEEARRELAQAVAMDGGHAEWHFNLGLACARLGRRDEAIAALRAAVAGDGGRYAYWTNLAALLDEAGDDAEAEHACRRAIALEPGSPDAHHLLTALLLRQGRFDEARRSNAEGVLAEPPGKMAPIAVGQALCELGRRDEAQALAESWLRQQPGHPVALHMLAAFGKGEPPLVCDGAYVGRAFDAAAADFEAALARLRYRGPQWLADCLAGQGIAPRSLSALDLGCGTGLAGAALRPYASRLDGVDLSAGMLAQARGKALYDALSQADLLDFLRDGGDSRYQLIACMDTLTYLGELAPLFGLLRRRQAPGGLLLFCTERLDDGDDADYRLHHSGRYRHHARYLERLLVDGWRVLARERLPVRDEGGCPVAGEFICAQRVDSVGDPGA